MRGFTERPSESKRLVLTSLPHQLQPAVWLGRNPHRRLFKATKHKLGVPEVIQGRKRKAPAFPVGGAPAHWLFRGPCGWRCHSEFHSKQHTCHSPEAHGPAQREGRGQDRARHLVQFLILCIQVSADTGPIMSPRSRVCVGSTLKGTPFPTASNYSNKYISSYLDGRATVMFSC